MPSMPPCFLLYFFAVAVHFHHTFQYSDFLKYTYEQPNNTNCQVLHSVNSEAGISLLNLYATVTPYLSIVFEPLTIFNHIMLDFISVEHIYNQQIGPINKIVQIWWE